VRERQISNIIKFCAKQEGNEYVFDRESAREAACQLIMLNENRQRREVERYLHANFDSHFGGISNIGSDGRLQKHHYEPFFMKLLGQKFF
jgi:hypothetical protein